MRMRGMVVDGRRELFLVPSWPIRMVQDSLIPGVRVCGVRRRYARAVILEDRVKGRPSSRHRCRAAVVAGRGDQFPGQRPDFCGR